MTRYKLDQLLVVPLIWLGLLSAAPAADKLESEMPILEERMTPPEMSGGVSYEKSQELYVTPESSFRITQEPIEDATPDISPSPPALK